MPGRMIRLTCHPERENGAREQGMSNSATEQLRSVKGPRRIALLAVMLSGPPLMALTFSTIAPVLPAMARHFGPQTNGTFFAQWIMTSPALGLMLGGALGGFLIDRIGPRLLIIAAFALFALGGSAGLYLDDPVALLISRFVLGLGGSCVATTATWLIGERFDELARHRMIGIQDSIAGIAAMSAVLLAGILGAATGWRAPFAIYLIAVPLLLLAILAVPRIAMSKSGQTPGETGALLASLWPVYLLVLAMAGLMMMPATQVPFLLEHSGVADPVTKSRVIACSAAMSILSAALYARIRRLLGERGTLSMILLVFALGTIILSQSSGAWSAAFGCMAMGIGTGIFSPHFANVVIARTPHAIRGRAIGLMYSTVFLSEFLSPLVILPLRRTFGVTGCFLVLGIALIVGFVISVLQKRQAFPSPPQNGSRHDS